MFQVQNIAGKTEVAKKSRVVGTEDVAVNYAKATSEFFHGVFEVKDGEAVICYFVGGRRFRKLDTAWAHKGA